MRKETSIKEISEIVLAFLYLAYETVDGVPPQIAVMHPIYESTIACVLRDNENAMLDISESDENLRLVQEQWGKRIKSATKLTELYYIVRKSYRLTFIKFAEPFLSRADMSRLLADAWVVSENPNQDANAKLPTVVKWFKAADKQVLMEPDDYATYQALPDKLNIYRGVAIGRTPYGLSWTQNRSKAEWFAHRFDKNDNIGYVQKAVANKDDVLAYFNTRGEEEIVIDTRILKDITIIA